MTTPTPSGSITPDKLKSMFEDLGKPTMRGVRKCPKCGTYNGTRGISCKNKNCDQVFKDKEKKKPPGTVEAVKIITGSTVQVFSVRLRDRGPDYRGFVQLPIVQDMDGNPATSVDPVILAQAARCYVESCVRSGQIDINHEPCTHIRAAINSDHPALPLTFKNSVLNSLQVTNDLKQEIWLLATMTTGPLVQRVSKNIMVVKCKANSKHPLGFLHFAFFEGTKNKSQENRYQCACRSQKEDGSKRCVHFYACICAFASDEKLSEEFSQYITMESGVVPQDASGRILTLYNSEPEDSTTEIVTADLSEESAPSIEVVIEDKEFFPLEPKRARKEDPIVQASNALLTLQESASAAPKKTPTTKPNPSGNKSTALAAKKATPIDEQEVSFSFHQWLASVTERVNQTMHYQFDGNPEPLVFHAPQVFFDCMQQRISTGNRKKRLPNFVAGFVRKDALPLGTFTKYTWHITNILHVKQIFDTVEMPLEITRSFVENRDGTYTVYETPNVKVESCEYGKNQTPIRPFELKTYLKVGHTQSDQKDPTPFIIEWIPDILPESHIGELRIKFEYGHQRNGQIEHRPPSQPVEMQTNIIQIQ